MLAPSSPWMRQNETTPGACCTLGQDSLAARLTPLDHAILEEMLAEGETLI